jgi:hypothetical protein
LYNGATNQKTKEEWDEQFYKPIFQKTYKHLKSGGYYCLNIPEEVFKTVAINILGKPETKIPLPKSQRSAGEKYHEYIYVWVK